MLHIVNFDMTLIDARSIVGTTGNLPACFSANTIAGLGKDKFTKKMFFSFSFHVHLLNNFCVQNTAQGTVERPKWK